MDRLIVYALALLLMGCETTPPSPAIIDETLPADEGQEEEIGPEPQASELPEPNKEELQQLHSWLAAQQTGFDLERMEDCQAQLLVRADRVQNRNDLQRAALELRDDVQASHALYHWCYFHMLSRLEYQLEQQSLGKTYQDRLQQFLRESKALFILAESLDKNHEFHNYRKILQKKYIALSQAWFGRSISPIDASGRTESRKPAAPYSDD